MTIAAVTQSLVETLESPAAAAAVTQDVIETLTPLFAAAGLTQDVIEVLSGQAPTGGGGDGFFIWGPV